jgi:hypothetical protein
MGGSIYACNQGVEGAVPILKLLLYPGLAFLLTIPTVRAAQLDDHDLQQIRETAASICNTVKETKGTKDEAQIQGDVRAQLSGLASKLGAEAEVSGKGSIDRSGFEGLTQDATALALAGDRDCRERLFNRMFDKATSAQTAPAQPTHNPNALYRYNEKIAEVQGAVIQQSEGEISFQVVHTTAQIDPAQELQYQDWIIVCPGLPKPKQAFVGTTNGMIIGLRCRIIRRAP